jgi:tetrahydromethanopterin S-methyltransferase subunit D
MGDQLRTSTMRAVAPVVLGALVCVLTVGATPASAQVSYTQITSQATVAGLGGAGRPRARTWR